MKAKTNANVKTALFRRVLGAALGVAVAVRASAADPVVVQSASNGYNAWPIVQAVGGKIVCAYSRGAAHDISQGARGVYARVSSDGGATWGDEVTVANDASCGEVAIGKGLDANGAMLLWVRCWGGANPHHDLYRTTDGIAFEKIATPALDPVPMQITDIFAVPGVGLMCLWFSDGYAASSVRAWGKLVSTDNGLTWARTTVETGLVTDEWPTEPSGVWLGDGKILVIARCEGSDRQFQIVSTDSGATWTKRQTNITDVRMSTPSLVYDATTGLVSNYYYQRGAKMLKRRVAEAADIFGRPDQWPQPELLYTGEESVAIDAGNVNVTVTSDGAHLAATYTGTSSNTKVVALAVAAPSQSGVLPGAVLLPPAKCYSQRGLVLHLDGRENAGAGLNFDPDATVWKDLSPSGNDANLTANGDFEDGTFGLQMKIADKNVYYAAVTKANLAAGLTAECLVKPTGGDPNTITTVWGGGGSNGDNIPLARARYQSDSFCFDDSNIKWKMGVVLGSIYQIALRSADGVRWTGWNDGVASTASYAPGNKLASAPFALGGFTGWPRRMTGTVYAMRVYDRPLSELEMKANAIIDHVRFEGANPMTAAWPDGFRYDPTTGEILVHVQLLAQNGLLVSLNGGAPADSIDEWMVRGTPYEAKVVSDGGEFEKWQDSASDLAEQESQLSTVSLYADLPRQLVASTEVIIPSAKSYSQRGLVLHLDGRENVGAGLAFDPDATVWKDLSPSGNDANLTANGDFEDGTYGLQMKIADKNVYYAAVTKANLTAGLTAECLVKPTGGDSGLLGTVWGGGGSNGENIPLPRARFNSDLKKFCFDDEKVIWKSGVVLGSVYQFSLRSTDGLRWTACNDGVASTASYAPGNKLASAPFALGGFTGWPRRMTGTVYAMRVYDRPLRELEMKVNALLDHVRFEGANPMAAAWPDGFRYDPTTGEIQVRVRLSARRGLLVSLNGGEPSNSIDAWIARGTPYEAKVVSDGGEFEKWTDSLEELTDQESRSETLTACADMPRELVASKPIRPLGRGDWRRFRHESKITFANCGIAASAPVADMPVLLRISSECPSGIDLADIASDGSDLAFASCPDGAWLDCCVDTWGADGGCVWVRIPSLSENTAIKMYWGLKSASAMWSATDTNVWANYTTVLHMNEKKDVNGSRLDSTRKNAFALDGDITLDEGVVGFAAKSSGGGSVRVAKGGPWEQAFTSESFTMSCWLRIDRAPVYPLFAQWASGPSQVGAGFWFGAAVGNGRADNGAVIWHGGNRGSNANVGPSKVNDPAWPANSTYIKKWLHYTLTCRNENGVAHTVNYIDGQKVNEIDITITNGKQTLFTAPSTASDLMLVNGPSQPSDVAQMDEFRLSEGVRTPAEVAADYQTMTKADFATFGSCQNAKAPNPGLAVFIN